MLFGQEHFSLCVLHFLFLTSIFFNLLFEKSIFSVSGGVKNELILLRFSALSCQSRIRGNCQCLYLVSTGDLQSY